MAATLAKIEEIETEMARTQKNKATSQHLGILKAKLAKLRRELIAPPKGGGGPSGEGFEVSKTGDARVGFIGFPSVGKSSLLTLLTGTASVAAAYEFTTLTCIPGMLYHNGAKIQMLDLPGIIEGAKDGKGRGRQVIAVARSCDLILIVLDASKPASHKRIIEKELEGFGIRLNKKPPPVLFRRKDRGGISFSSAVQTDLNLDVVKSVCAEYRLHNADFVVRGECSIDEIIDVIEGNRRYVPALYIVNMIDKITMEELELYHRMDRYVPICGKLQWNIDGLLEKIWDDLQLVRIYTKPKGVTVVDFSEPVILKNEERMRTVAAFCRRIHKTLENELKFALVWGRSTKFNPQKCGKDHVLCDEDVIQLVKQI
ncbi:GTP-binding protein of Obg-family [Chondrus crispus]|uniref:GTP-binding protein of Obg-family n=1 Tax=Chondrus crispus TaxID=2769 RepID=R7Q0C2_CHOCR|nr:GTP-binding protein of Obg-family [Chondrus crispus]CDF32097.1 GTP-binding protein of Obg-family [Chondrus crispus]|eukprot:XP_005711762.1 GTP-binding protein of Obg-family [Chondrus crispus]